MADTEVLKSNDKNSAGNNKDNKNTGKKQSFVKGLKKESIEIVIEKSKCSREQAIKALKECNGDITEALLTIDLNNKQ